MLKIFLLGPFRVLLPSGETARFSAHSAAAVIALLALRPGRRLSREALAQLLWPDCPGARAAGNLRQALWRLKQALGEASDRLTVEREEIALQAGTAVWIDLDAFLNTTDPDLLKGALLEGWHDEWVLRERDLLQAEALRRLGEAAAAALAGDDAATALRHAERLVSHDPLREEGHRLVMSAHLALGQPTAALQQYRFCRSILAQELGVEPGEELRALASQARAATRPHDPPPPRRTRPTPATPLVGRTQELDLLLQMINGAGPSQALLLGEPGIGKSRLVEATVTAALQSAYRVILTACHDCPAPPPHELLASVVRAMGADRLRKLTVAQRATLSIILPELGTPIRTTPGDDRHRLLSVVSDVLREVAGGDPFLLVLEDIQWADPASLRMLETLWPRLEGLPFRLLATLRTDALAEREDVAQWAARQENAGRLLRLDLKPLAPAETAELAEVLAPGASPLYATWLHTETNGNPLFITELVQATLHQPTEPPAELPTGMFRVLRWRLASLEEQARDLLRAGAVLGLSFTADQLRAVCGLDEAELLTQLDDLLLRGLLVEQGAGLRFYHARFRDVVLADIARARLQSLHRRAARAATDDAAAAHHAEAGEEWELAAEKLGATGYRAFQAGAHLEAMELYNRALAAADKAPRRREELQATVLRGREQVLASLGRQEERSADIDRLEQLAELTGNRSLAAYAANRRSRLLHELQRYDAAEREGKRAVLLASRSDGDLPGAHLGLARHYKERGRARQWVEQAQAALRTARESGSLLWEGRALLDLAWAYWSRVRPGAAAVCAEEAIAVGLRLNDVEMRVGGSFLLASCLLLEGRGAQSVALLQEQLALAGQRGCRALELTARAALAHTLRSLGHLAEAAREAEALYAVAVDMQWPRMLALAEREMAWTCLSAGQHAEALAHGRRLLNLTMHAPVAADPSEGGEVWVRACLAAGEVAPALRWAREQHSCLPGRHPLTSLRVCAAVADVLRAAGEAKLACRWSRWAHRWQRYLKQEHLARA